MLYQSDWSKAPPHAHAYRARTSTANGHYHLIEGFSQPANGSNTDGHVHFYSGITSFDKDIITGITRLRGPRFRGRTARIIMKSGARPIWHILRLPDQIWRSRVCKRWNKGEAPAYF